MVRYIVSAASDPTVASHAGADRLCGRNRRVVHDVSITNNCSSDLMSHSAKTSAKVLGRCWGWVVMVLSLTQAQNWAFWGPKTRLRRPIPTLASKTHFPDKQNKPC